MITESKRGLHHNIRLKGPPEPRREDYSNSICAKFYLSNNRVAMLDKATNQEHGFDTAIDFLKYVIQYRRIMLFAPNGENDIPLRLFRYGELLDLANEKKVRRGRYILMRTSPNKLTIRRGNDWTSIYNVAPYSKETLDDILLLDSFKTQILKLESLLDGPINLSSATTNAIANLHFLTRDLPAEMSRVQDLTNDDLDLVWSTIHNTWMSPNRLGTTEGTENFDSYKAHLRAMGKIPSIRKGKSKISREPIYTPNALMGFYLVSFNFPNIKNTGIITTRYRGRLVCFHGPRTQYVAKPVLDKLSEMHIDFRVHKAVEFLPVGGIEHPFRSWARIWEKIIDQKQYTDFSKIDLKTLVYKTIVGMMIHTHEAEEQPDEQLNSDDILHESTRFFNPMVASTVYSLVNIRVFEQLVASTNPLYRRHDGGSRLQETGRIHPQFRIETQGRLFTYSSIIHDNPGSSLWHEIVSEIPDESSLTFTKPGLMHNMDTAECVPENIYTERLFIQTIRPLPDKMILDSPIKCNRALLEGNTPNHQPSAEEVGGYAENNYNPDLNNKWGKYSLWVPKK